MQRYPPNEKSSIVLVNMVSLFQGGPRTVGVGLLEGIKEYAKSKDLGSPSVVFILLLPSGVGFEELLEAETSDRIRAIFVNYPFVPMRFVRKLWLDQVYTPWVCHRSKASVVVMTANFASLLVKKSVRQIVLQHNTLYLEPPHHFQNSSKKFAARLWLEKALFYSCAKKKVQWIVQLESTKKRLAAAIQLRDHEITVVSMPVLNEFRRTIEILNRSAMKAECLGNVKRVKIIFPAKAHPNKNHHLIPALVRAFYRQGVDSQVYVTLDEPSPLLAELRQQVTEERIINLGYCSIEGIARAYKFSDLLFFPSASESYGFPLVEALEAGIPILAPDKDFVREISGDSAFYFDLSSPETLDRAVEEYLKAVRSGTLETRLEKRRGNRSLEWRQIVRQICTPGAPQRGKASEVEETE